MPRKWPPGRSFCEDRRGIHCRTKNHAPACSSRSRCWNRSRRRLRWTWRASESDRLAARPDGEHRFSDLEEQEWIQKPRDGHNSAVPEKDLIACGQILLEQESVGERSAQAAGIQINCSLQ